MIGFDKLDKTESKTENGERNGTIVTNPLDVSVSYAPDEQTQTGLGNIILTSYFRQYIRHWMLLSFLFVFFLYL